MSIIVKHAIVCPIPGYEALQATFNVGATGAQVDAANREGATAPFLLDLENWEEVATAAELVDADGKPLEKPLPIKEHANSLPLALLVWLSSNATFYEAVGDYVRSIPNSRKR